MHVVGVVLWVGGLLALVWYARTDGRYLPLAAQRFSALAFWAFLSVGVSGAVNALIRLGDIDALFTTQYGAVVLIKVMAFVALGLLGWAHRRHTIPQLVEDVPHAFTRLAAVEAAIMVFTHRHRCRARVYGTTRQRGYRGSITGRGLARVPHARRPQRPARS